MVNLSVDGREQVVGLEASRRLARLRRHRRRRVRVRRRRHGHRRGLGRSATTSCSRPASPGPALLSALHGAMSREIGARSRFADVRVHACRPMPASPISCATGPQSLAPARPAQRPDHAAHDARRDRQLPGHDARDREPRPVASSRATNVIAFTEKGRRDLCIPDVARARRASSSAACCRRRSCNDVRQRTRDVQSSPTARATAWASSSRVQGLRSSSQAGGESRSASSSSAE